MWKVNWSTGIVETESQREARLASEATQSQPTTCSPSNEQDPAQASPSREQDLAQVGPSNEQNSAQAGPSNENDSAQVFDTPAKQPKLRESSSTFGKALKRTMSLLSLRDSTKTRDTSSRNTSPTPGQEPQSGKSDRIRFFFDTTLRGNVIHCRPGSRLRYSSGTDQSGSYQSGGSGSDSHDGSRPNTGLGISEKTGDVTEGSANLQKPPIHSKVKGKGKSRELEESHQIDGRLNGCCIEQVINVTSSPLREPLKDSNGNEMTSGYEVLPAHISPVPIISEEEADRDSLSSRTLHENTSSLIGLADILPSEAQNGEPSNPHASQSTMKPALNLGRYRPGTNTLKGREALPVMEKPPWFAPPEWEYMPSISLKESSIREDSAAESQGSQAVSARNDELGEEKQDEQPASPDEDGLDEASPVNGELSEENQAEQHLFLEEDSLGETSPSCNEPSEEKPDEQPVPPDEDDVSEENPTEQPIYPEAYSLGETLLAENSGPEMQQAVSMPRRGDTPSQRNIRYMQATPNKVVVQKLTADVASKQSSKHYRTTELHAQCWLQLGLKRLISVWCETEKKNLHNLTRVSPDGPSRVLSLHENHGTVITLSFITEAKETHHVAIKPVHPTRYGTIHQCAVGSSYHERLPYDDHFFSMIQCLPLPIMAEHEAIPKIIRECERLLLPEGKLRVTLMDAMPTVMGPKLRAWMSENLLPTLRTESRVLHPSRTIPRWLELNGFTWSVNDSVHISFPAVKETDGKDPNDPAKLLHVVGRALWKEIWGTFAVGKEWWWEDSVILKECSDNKTRWECSVIYCRKKSVLETATATSSQQ